MQLSAVATLKQKLVSQAIRDPLFEGALGDAAKEIRRQSASAENEATVESAFERVLYATLKDVGIAFHPKKEKPIKTRRHVAKGRTDSRLGGVIIEYKQPSTLKTETAIDAATEQLTGYLVALAEELDNDVVGFLSDGLKILEVHVDTAEKITVSAFQALSSDSLGRLVRSVVSLEHSALTAENLIRDFCDKTGRGTIFDLARRLNRILRDTPTAKTSMLRMEWEALFRLAHDDNSQQQRIEARRQALSELFRHSVDSSDVEYRALFALDTAYAIVLKTMAYRVVSDLKFKRTLIEYKSLLSGSTDNIRAFSAALEDGEIFRNIGVLNLLEGDFFSWYSDEDQWNDDIAEGVSAILATLSRYEDTHTVFKSANAVDLFRSLYEATVPQAVRSSLGEFYTPYWLADHVLESSGLQPNWSALDPCCGSGTFIIAAIARLRADRGAMNNRALVKTILSRIAGFDLNPLAVLTSRIHFFIHIADLIEGYPEDIVIPIFLGDASNVPTRVKRSKLEFLSYSLDTVKGSIDFQIPLYLADNIGLFAAAMHAFESSIKAGDFSAAKADLLAFAGADNRPSIVADSLNALSDRIIELEQKKWNGIWARIIANFVITARIGPFSNIIGNPPWVDWKSLPSVYRDKIKSLCIDKGLFSGAGRTGGINLNVCALIAHVAATNWLKKGGRMALLMPKELAIQASYEGWRRSVGGTRLALTGLHDWTNAGHPFDPVKEDFMTFVFEEGEKQKSLIPVTVYSKKDRRSKAHQWVSLAEAKQRLDVSSKVAGRIIEGSTSYTFADSESELRKLSRVAGRCEYKGREGIEFYPQELLLLRYVEPGPKSGLAWMRNIQVGRSKYKIPAQRVLMETKYLFPLVKGPEIGRMRHDDSDIYVIFPYEETDPHSPVPATVLRKSCPQLYTFLQKYRKILEQQTHYSNALQAGVEFYGLARTGPYSFRDKYVAFRDNSKWCATVITTKQTPWGDNKRYVFQNHAVSMCENMDGTYMSLAEAYFVSGIFNAPVVQKFIYASSDNRSFKIRPPIFVPTFDPKDERHKRIASLSKRAHTGKDAPDTVLPEIEKLYLAICPKGKPIGA